jgi:hypothetical protein
LGEDRYGGIAGILDAGRGLPVKLDANEAAEDFPPPLKEEVLRRLRQWNSIDIRSGRRLG